MEYIETPIKKLITRKGGKGNKMPNTNKIEAAKTAKKYAKTRGEHIKDVLIAVLVTGIVAFIGGAVFANNHNAEISRAVQSVTPVAEAQPSK